MARYTTDQSNSPVFRAGSDPGAGSFAWRSLTAWLLGHPEQAEARRQEVLALVRELAQPYSMSFALWASALVSHCRRDVPRAHEEAEKCVHLSLEHGFALWSAGGAILQHWAEVMQGKQETGVKQMLEGVAAWRATGAGVLVPCFLTLLAEGYGAGGQVDEGLQALAEAQALVDRDGEHWCEAELQRLKGQLLLQDDPANAPEAEACFHRALEIARAQQARSWELRAATSLARLWRDQGKPEQARELLAPVYDWFTEGFDTADLKQAKVLIDDLEAGQPTVDAERLVG